MKLKPFHKEKTGIPLWTKSFTIVTVGSVISYMGNATMSFIMSLIMLDVSQSVLIYSLCLACEMVGEVLMPVLIGPHLDRYSRKRMIYCMDFSSASIYLIYGIAYSFGVFPYWMPMVGNVLLGGIDSVYRTSYSSLIPMVVQKENLQKAYSITGVLEEISLSMSPVAIFLYQYVGVRLVLFIGAAVFFTAAVTELFIEADESSYLLHVKPQANYRQEMLVGLEFVKKNRCLLYCCIAFFAFHIASGMRSTALLPYYETQGDKGFLWYFLVMECFGDGCIVGDFITYRLNIPDEKRYGITVLLFCALTAVNIPSLWTPWWGTCILLYLGGIFEQIIINYQKTTTNAYVDNAMRGRFTGIYNMSINLGFVIGQLGCGVVEKYVSLPLANSGTFALVTVPFLISFVLLGKKEIQSMYNLKIESPETQAEVQASD